MIDIHSAEHYTWGEGCDGWHLVKTPALSVIQERMPPGTFEKRHYHNHARQFFYILAGQATLEVAGIVHTLQAHQGLEIPPGTPHQVFNHSDANLEFLVTSCPPSHGDRVDASGV